MKLIDVLLRKNGHEQTREADKEQVKQRLNEVERKITLASEMDNREGLRSG